MIIFEFLEFGFNMVNTVRIDLKKNYKIISNFYKWSFGHTKNVKSFFFSLCMFYKYKANMLISFTIEKGLKNIQIF